MAASKPVEPQSAAGLPRWQLALLVGTPIVLGVGAVYLWNRNRSKKDRKGKGNGERKTPDGSASPVQGQDGEARANRELENMVKEGLCFRGETCTSVYCDTVRSRV